MSEQSQESQLLLPSLETPSINLSAPPRDVEQKKVTKNKFKTDSSTYISVKLAEKSGLGGKKQGN